MSRKKRLTPLLMAAVFMIFGGGHSFADDMDIHTNGSGGVEPNVLIVFDNSASMNNEMASAVYDPAATYPGIYDSAKVYYQWKGSWNRIFRDSTAEIICIEAVTALETEGFYNGKIDVSTTQCEGTQTNYLRTGNYGNFLRTGGTGTLPRLGVAKGTIQSYINTTAGVRFGAMIFNPEEGGYLLREVREMIPQNRSDLHNAIGQIAADTWTPLAETLYEAGLYFKGEEGYFNSGVTYTSPITDWCQKNYVIMITDGESTKDRNSILTSLGINGDVDGDGADPGNYDGGDGADSGAYEDEGSDYLDDVAKYLYDMDLKPDLKEKQNLITYTIGFTVGSQLLEDTAKNGRGEYFYVHNAQSFRIVFQKIIQNILEESTSFTAPVVPISQTARTTSGDKLYLALFKPTENTFWKGNIKKYSIAGEDIGDIQRGDVLDVNGNLATNDKGVILDTAVSFWGDGQPDGGEADAGGVGEVLLNRTAPRNIYTWIDSNEPRLTHPNNAFSKTNPGLTKGMLQIPLDTERAKIIDLIHGYDAYDEDLDLDTIETRRWILGAFLHSRPVVVHYDDSTSVVFAGANDGMLHAFDDSDGSELWGFIPPDVLGRLKNLSRTNLDYFVDGTPEVAIIDNDMDGVIEPDSPDDDQVILVFGERRGGSHYYALDVSNPYAPELLWHLGPDQTEFSEMGQSWSTPVIRRVAYNDQWVVFLGGGYDTNQDAGLPVSADGMGRGIYMVDLFDGSLVWKYTAQDNPDMTHCIPSDIAAVDTDGSGYTDRLYVGDTGGQMWRFDIAGSVPGNWTGKMIFHDSGGGRKIFYPPDVVFEQGFEMLFWGTGDRANPKDQSVINRIYALKDRDPLNPLTETNLVDVTANLVQDGTDLEKAQVLADLKSAEGWYIELDEHAGEKIMAPSITYFGVVYLTTLTPIDSSGTDPCYGGQGIARLYALDYKTAAAVLNFDTTSDKLEKSDRSKIIGSATPSGVVIAIIEGKGSSYIGVGGGIITAEMHSPPPITRMYWRQLS